MREAAPNVPPQQAPPLAGGMARLLERIWGPADLDDPAAWQVEDARAIEAAAQLAVNLRTYQEHEPDADPEAIAWQDSLARADATIMPGVYEVARMVGVQLGATILRQIQTWARISALDPTTGQPLWTTELRAPPDSLTAFGGLALSPSSSMPFPFPLDHPGVPGSTLRIRWSLRVDEQGTEDTPALPYLAGGTPDTSIPVGVRFAHLPGDWEDMRYPWNALQATPQRWVVGTYALVRLFATVVGDPNLWRVSVAGRLSGFTQSSGRRRRALANVTTG